MTAFMIALYPSKSFEQRGWPNLRAELSQALTDELTAFLQAHLEEGTTLEAFLDAAGERGFGLIVIIASLPMLLPLPPGTSFFLGFLISFLALQAFTGRSRIWLPQVIKRRRISPRAIAFLIHRALPLLSRFERIGAKGARGHLTRRQIRYATMVTVGIGLVLAAPIPIFSIIPTIVALALGVGLIQENPRLLKIGMVAATSLLTLIAGGLSVVVAFY